MSIIHSSCVRRAVCLTLPLLMACCGKQPSTTEENNYFAYALRIRSNILTQLGSRHAEDVRVAPMPEPVWCAIGTVRLDEATENGHPKLTHFVWDRGKLYLAKTEDENAKAQKPCLDRWNYLASKYHWPPAKGDD